MKRQSVFLQRMVEDGWSVGRIFEVFRRSMKCSPSAPHFKSLSQICFRCQWLWHLPPRTACWAANLWRFSGIMVTTSFKKGSNFAEGSPICWPFRNLEGGEGDNLWFKARLKSCFEFQDDDPFGDCEVTTTIGGVGTSAHVTFMWFLPRWWLCRSQMVLVGWDLDKSDFSSFFWGLWLGCLMMLIDVW